MPRAAGADLCQPQDRYYQDQGIIAALPAAAVVRSTGRRPMPGRRDGLGRPRGPPGHHGPIAQPSPRRGTAAGETTIEPGLHPTRGTSRVGVGRSGDPWRAPSGPPGLPEPSDTRSKDIRSHRIIRLRTIYPGLLRKPRSRPLAGFGHWQDLDTGRFWTLSKSCQLVFGEFVRIN